MTLLPFTLTSLSEDHLPGVTRSSSEETPSVDDSFGSYHTTASSVTDKYVPTTPEGLRPRQSLQEVREALGVHSRVLQELDQLQANLPPSRLYLPNASTPTLLPCLPPLRHCDVSPMASKSSFYSRASSSTMVAESPNFHLGQTRTAVGALVARNSKPYSTFDDQLITSSILPPLDLGVLSPRTMIDQDEDDVYSEPRSIGYHELDDSMEVGTPRRFLDQANSAASHTTASFQASPIRRTEPSNKDDMSFSSQLGLVEFGKGMHMYNFDPIVAVGDQLTNVSAMSHSMVDDSSLISYGHTVQSKDSAKHFYPSKHLPQYLHTMDADLMLRKQHNQRKAKEKLLCDVVTRLQDDMELMDEVEKLHDDDDDDGVVHWFVKTNFDEEGLLTGYSETSRIALLKYFQSLLTEIDTAQSDEFYLSPSQRGEFRDSHDDLRQTLSFMVRLIETSPCKVQRWVCHKELRVAMGIPAHSKYTSTTRGGDSSLFSLPSESTTPHTSNMSMSSSITTMLSPTRRSGKHMEEKASSIRRITEIVGTLLQKMTIACNKVIHKQDIVRAIEEVKRNYLQLLALNRGDLTNFVDGFLLEEGHGENTEPVTIVRQVSNDENDVLPKAIPSLGLYFLESPRQLICEFEHDESKGAMFSPNSDDMRTATVVEDDAYDVDDEFEYDDLRRTIGSNDYDGGEMAREGPDQIDRECSWEREDPMQHVHASLCH